jgi:hypothetical protein
VQTPYGRLHPLVVGYIVLVVIASALPFVSQAPEALMLPTWITLPWSALVGGLLDAVSPELLQYRAVGLLATAACAMLNVLILSLVLWAWDHLRAEVRAGSYRR